jgi:hypothetical protein
MGYKLKFENDITMCATEDCPMEVKCLRKVAMCNPDKSQSMAAFEPVPDDKGVIHCEGYIYSVVG